MSKTKKQIIVEEFTRLLELSILDKAEDIALQAHLHQKRKGVNKPYFIHPKRVQLLAKKMKYGIDVQIVALLHDVIEDTENVKYYYDLIKSKFGQEILNSVLLLSHDKSVPYDSYLEQLAKSNTESAKLSFKVKMLDMSDNLTDMPTDSQKLKYKNAIINLIDKGYKDKIPVFILNLLKIHDEVLQEAPKQDTPKSPKEKEPADDAPTDAPTDDSSGDGEDMKDIPGDMDSAGEGGKPSGGTDDLFGDEPLPGDDGPDGGEDSEPDKKEMSITQYNEKLKSSKKIDKQRNQVEPGFDFTGETDFYNENYVSQTPKGSLLIAVPNITSGNLDLEFVKTVAVPKIIKVVYEAMKSGRDVVLLGDYGLPYYDGKYSKSISGIIAKVLNEKFKGTVKFDTWNPQNYYSFVSNTDVWKELKSRTEAENAELKSALYLFLLATEKNDVLSNKLKTDNVKEVLNKWGLTTELSIQTDKEQIHRAIFPDTYSNPETLASYIIKTYLQLLRVNMLKKVIQYEKQNMVVVIPTDANTAWTLNDSFKSLDDIQKSNVAKDETPDEMPDEKDTQPKDETPEDAEKQEK